MTENYFKQRKIFIDPEIPTDSQWLPDLNRKTVLVMGGSRGIGAEFARLAHEQGARVMTVSRHNQPTPWSSSHLVADLSTSYGINSVWARSFMADIVFNNVGVYEQDRIVDTTLSRWRKVIDTNLTSMFLLNRHALKRLDRDGVIINMASRPTLEEYGTWSTYTLTKQGVITLTQAASEEAEKGIKVYALCPSRVDTGFREELFPGEPKNQRLTTTDTAMALMFLANRSLPSGSFYWIKQLYD